MLLGAFAALSLLIGVVTWLISGNWWMLPVTAVGCFLLLVAAMFLFLLYLCKRVDQDVPGRR